MDWLRKLFNPHLGEEWDAYTNGWVREGWIAERQGYMDKAYEGWQQGEPMGTCLACNNPIENHPMPARMWRSGPDLCAQTKERSRNSPEPPIRLL